MVLQPVVAPEQEKPNELNIQRKQHFVGKVIKITTAGAIVDIGLPRPAVVHISQLSKEPVKRVEDVVQVGQEVDVWVRRINPKGIIELTMIEPLPLEWREIKKGMVVKGKVEAIEQHGILVNIGAEVPAFVHVSELSHDYVRHPGDLYKVGDEVEGKIIVVNRRRKQIKLSIKALLPKPEEVLKEMKQEAQAEAVAKAPAPRKAKAAEKAAKVNEAPQAEAEQPTTYDPTPMEIALMEALERARAEAEQATGKARKAALRRVEELERLLAATRGSRNRLN